MHRGEQEAAAKSRTMKCTEMECFVLYDDHRGGGIGRHKANASSMGKPCRRLSVCSGMQKSELAKMRTKNEAKIKYRLDNRICLLCCYSSVWMFSNSFLFSLCTLSVHVAHPGSIFIPLLRISRFYSAIGGRMHVWSMLVVARCQIVCSMVSLPLLPFTHLRPRPNETDIYRRNAIKIFSVENNGLFNCFYWFSI